MLTFLAGMVDAIISFCFSMYVTLAVTSVIWFVIALLWCLMAMKFRHIAYESECQRISLNIQDTLRRAPITQKEAQ